MDVNMLHTDAGEISAEISLFLPIILVVEIVKII